MFKRITIISNICFEPYLLRFIKEEFSYLYNDSQVNVVLYEDYKESQDNITSSDIIAVCLNIEELCPDLSGPLLSTKESYACIEEECFKKCNDLYLSIKACCNVPIIWFGFEDYYYQIKNYGTLVAFDGLVDRLNLKLKHKFETDSFIDFKRLIATVGIKNAFDSKGKYRWNSPYSKEMISLIANEIYKQHLIATGNTKKCLVLDCDNVLWGGILSEDGIEGIEISHSGLGKPFQDFQRYLLDLYYHGVILAVCSKNEESDVLRVFKEHTGMLLKEEHFACLKCNWNSKSENIKEIAGFLNIGLDSIVFVDDSVFEIESVKTMLPEVTSILYQRDTVYEDLSCFNLKRYTDLKRVKERTNTYQTNKFRMELQKSAATFEEYISSLKMVIDIHKMKVSEIARVSELTQRTNKCTNGVRYTLNELKEKSQSNLCEIYTVCLSDRFSDLGVVGVIGIIDNSKVEVFSLSCRALGRGIEDKMVNFALSKNVTKVKIIDTGKNKRMNVFFKRAGIMFEE